LPMVKYLLEECIARPMDDDGKKYPLVDHLKRVAYSMGDPHGDHLTRLSFLAGLLHDAGKALQAWQDYIRLPKKQRKKGVPHSFAGAMLFALMLMELLENWKPDKREREEIIHHGLRLIYYIYSHHGQYPDIVGEYPPWQGDFTTDDLFSADLSGIIDLICQYFCELDYLKDNSNKQFFESKFEAIAFIWPKWQSRFSSFVVRNLRKGNRYAQSASLCVQNHLENHRLIASDRLHAAGINDEQKNKSVITASQAVDILHRISMFCSRRTEKLTAAGANQLLLKKRELCKANALDIYNKTTDAKIFSLELPTGYGKTLTALSVALTSIAKGKCQRIIYVAPYISILSQAADEIREATGLDVLLHHHLSALNSISDENVDEELESIYLDSWLAPVIATTYNQLFRALFPIRSQHTLRLTGLQNAFIIIDEPQSIATASWNPFLSLVEAASKDLNCCFLFVTATLPVLEGGIFESSCVSLGREEPLFSRYYVENMGQLDENTLASHVAEEFKKTGSVAVILNTVKDAALVYRKSLEYLQDYLKENPEAKVFFLSGMLTPQHKHFVIEQIKAALQANTPVLVVCTQILEAGVDLSFRVVFRALPLIPSLIQAAGRCNRHGEKNEKGLLYFFDFRRGGETDTRRFVYRNANQRDISDECLEKYPNFEEKQSLSIISNYYHECYQRLDSQATLQKIEDAAKGYASELFDIEPFGNEGMFKYSVFVPKVIGELSETILNALKYFRLDSLEDLWEKYTSPDFYIQHSYVERKRLMGLMSQFIVQVHEEIAREIGEPYENRSILRLRYPSLYETDIGLSIVAMNNLLAEQFI